MSVLPSNLIKEFVKETNDMNPSDKSSSTHYGTAVVNGTGIYVKFDGSEILTPVSMATDAKNGDRVLVTIENHKARIVSNFTSPASGRTATDLYSVETTEDGTVVVKGELRVAKEYVDELIGNDITAATIKAQTGEFESLKSKQAEFENTTTENLKATNAELEKVTGDFATFKTGEFEDLKAKQATFESITTNELSAIKASIEDLDVDTLEAKYAKIEDLETANARIGVLEAGQITAEYLDSHYAQINLANIEDGSITTAMIGTGVVGTAQIADGSITDAKIVGMTADKITAGVLDAGTIDVINLKAENITVGTINGHQIAQGAVDMSNLADSVTGKITAAQTTADGKNTVYYQSSAPTGAKKNDIWFNTEKDNQISIFDGSKWVIEQFGANAIEDGIISADKIAGEVNTKIQNAFDNAATANSTANSAKSTADSALSAANSAKSAAATAQTTADGKNTVFYQTAAPSTTGRKINDIWFDTDDGNKMYCWNGSAWTAKQFGTNAVANASITNALIADATIQSAKIAALDAAKITSGYLAAARIQTGTLSADKLTAKTITADSGVLADACILTANIADLSVSGGKIANAAIGTAKIADLAVTNAKLANLSVTNAKIADATIQSAKIAALDAAKITTGTLSADRIGAGTIKASHIAAGAVSADKIAAGAVTAEKLYVGSGANIYNRGYDTFDNIPNTAARIYYQKASSAAVAIDTTTAYYGSRCLKIVSSGADAYVFLGDSANAYGCVPVTAGKIYIVSAWMKASASISVQMYVVGHTAANNTNSTYSSTTATVGTGWTRVYFRYKASDTYPYISIRVDNDTSGTTLWVDAIMIEPGTATQIPSEFSPAGVTVIDGGRIAAQSITGTQISSNAINANHITAGAVTADKMSVTSLDSISAKIGVFHINNALYTNANAFGTTANNIYIGSSGISLGTAFKVTSDGELTATSGKIGDLSLANGFLTGTGSYTDDDNAERTFTTIFSKKGLSIESIVGTDKFTKYASKITPESISFSDAYYESSLGTLGIYISGSDGNDDGSVRGSARISGEFSQFHYGDEGHDLYVNMSMSGVVLDYVNDSVDRSCTIDISANGLTLTGNTSQSATVTCTDVIANGWAYVGQVHFNANRSGNYISCANYNGYNNYYYASGYHAFYVNGSTGMLWINDNGLSMSGEKGLYSSTMGNYVARYYVAGSTKCTAIGNNSYATRIYGSSVWANKAISTSDERLKTDFKSLDEMTNVFMELEPVSFKWKNDYEDGDNLIHFGLKAGQVKGTFEKHGYNTDDYSVIGNFGGYMGICYDDLFMLTMCVTQKNTKELMYQTGKIDLHETIIQDLQNRIYQLEKQLKEVRQAAG